MPLTVLTPTTDHRAAAGAGPDRAGLGVHDLLRSRATPRGRRTSCRPPSSSTARVVKPGEVFSLNATLGPRTLEPRLRLRSGDRRTACCGRAWAAASASSRRRSSTPPSSPACRSSSATRTTSSSTTTRSAATPRSPGASQDLKFRNDTGHALMVRCWADNGQLTVGPGRHHWTHGRPTRRARSTTSSRRARRALTRGSSTTTTCRAASSRSRRATPGARVKVVRTVSAGRQGAVSRDTFVSTLRAQGLDQAHRHEVAEDGPVAGLRAARLYAVLAMTCLQTTLSVSKTPSPLTAQASITGELRVVEQLVEVFDREDVGEVALVHLDDEARAW